jgi:hypothetical protein
MSKKRKVRDSNFRPESVGDYPVGYGKPDKRTQFQPGTSGNRKGRPKGSVGLSAGLMKQLKQVVPMREGNRTRHVSKYEGMAAHAIAKVLQGKPSGVAELLKLARLAHLMEHHEKEPLAEVLPEGTTAIEVTFVPGPVPPRAGDCVDTDEYGNVFVNAEGEADTTILLNPPLRTKRIE